MADRLGVRTSCEAVVRSSKHVRIDDEATSRLAGGLLTESEPPGWDTDLHYRATGEDGDERTAIWILVLDALNFCFWSDDPQHRWQVRHHGELVDGYVALVAALTRAVEQGYPLHDPQWLATVSREDVAAILEPEPDHAVIPLLNERVTNLRELGEGLLAFGAKPATSLIESAGDSAVRLVELIVSTFPSFNDVTVWPYAETGLENGQVRFYKRAQILVGDLAGGLEGSPLVNFSDFGELTAFADYKVPQILRWLGVLQYDETLATMVDNRIRIMAGSHLETEIRAATIVACDRLVVTVKSLGRDTTAAEVDWLLWSRSQDLSSRDHPYHLTETIYY